MKIKHEKLTPTLPAGHKWRKDYVLCPLSDRSSSAHHAYAKWPGSSTRKIRIPSMRQSFDGRHVGLNPYPDANCSRQIANHNVMSMYTRVGFFPVEFKLSAHPSAIRAVALGENNGWPLIFFLC